MFPPPCRGKGWGWGLKPSVDISDFNSIDTFPLHGGRSYPAYVRDCGKDYACLPPRKPSTHAFIVRALPVDSAACGAYSQRLVRFQRIPWHACRCAASAASSSVLSSRQRVKARLSQSSWKWARSMAASWSVLPCGRISAMSVPPCVRAPVGPGSGKNDPPHGTVAAIRDLDPRYSQARCHSRQRASSGRAVPAFRRKENVAMGSWRNVMPNPNVQRQTGLAREEGSRAPRPPGEGLGRGNSRG